MCSVGESVNKAVSDYMRDMQARSAKSRWAGMTAAEKSAAMKALRAKGKRKPKRAARRLLEFIAAKSRKLFVVKDAI